MSYSDTKLEPKTCTMCNGSGIVKSNLKNAGQKCTRCDGSGKRYPLRRHALQDAFRDGDLPEQDRKAPESRWCPDCRPNGVFRNDDKGKPKHLSCGVCEGKTIIALNAAADGT